MFVIYMRKEINMFTINDVMLLKFPQLGDERGEMVVIEGNTSVPFEIKRLFYIYGMNSDIVRGQHANKITDFVMISLCGSVKIRIVDGNGEKKEIAMDKPFTGVYIPHTLWKDMYDFSPNSVLLVLASEHYDSGEYIRDISDFYEYYRRIEQ